MLKHYLNRILLAMLLLVCAALAACKSGGDGPDPPPDDEFTFRTDLPGEYEQVDRIGMPLIGSAFITSHDEYNEADPLTDVSGEFQLELQTNITALQDAVEDDLIDAGFAPADTNRALQQAGALIMPDTLKIDIDDAAFFPNGRVPDDPAADLLLALLLLNLTVEDIEDFADIPLNPPFNDADFSPVFPHLADPAEVAAEP